MLLGRGGNDSLVGGIGNDRLIGDAGADNLTGGVGADSFVFRSNFADGTSSADVVTDFGDGDDWLVFDTDFEGNITVTDFGPGVRLDVADGIGGTIGAINVEGAAAQSLKGASLGGGVFDLTDDETFVVFSADGDLLLS